MSSQVVDWLSKGFLETVLRKSQSNDTIKVKNVTTKPATATGDNYLSDMIRASVEYTHEEADCTVTENKSLIIKIAPFVDGLDKELVQGLEVFDTEIRMMEDTLEKMNAIIDEKDYRLNAHVLFTKRGDPSLLVIEDLATLGFRMADRQAGLDLAHCTLAMRGIAKFHAAAVALNEKEPRSVSQYIRGVFHENNPKKFQTYFEDAMKVVGDEVGTWTELGSDRHMYAEKLISLSKVCYRKAASLAKSNDTEFNVLNHGDFWVNNMLFRYDKKSKVVEHIFVDFQLPVWTSPVLDIMYFLCTSLAEDIDLHHRDDLIKEYLKTLLSTMSRLRCKTKPPSLIDLEKCMHDREFLGVILSCIFMPFILVDKSEAQNLDEILQKGEGYVNPAYKGQEFRRRMVKRLPEWNTRGLLDV